MVIFIWCMSTCARVQTIAFLTFTLLVGLKLHSEPVSSPSTTRLKDGVCALIHIIGTAAAGRADRGGESPVSYTHAHTLARSLLQLLTCASPNPAYILECSSEEVSGSRSA